MNNKEIAELLQSNYQRFIVEVDALAEIDFCYVPENKWSAAQQLDHLVRSVRPVNLAFGLPVFILKMLFGKSNRPSKSYEEVIAKYQTKIAAGAKATGRFIPPMIHFQQKEKLLKQLSGLVASLVKKTARSSENKLDTYILPHPLLGKITLREMLYFTAYHVQHHQNIIERDLQNN